MSLLSSRRVFVDSLPIAAILLFWVLVSWLGAHPLLGTGARIAGLVMALTYAVVKGFASAPHAHSPSALADVGSVLRINGLALLAAVGWFIGARVIIFAEQAWSELALPGAFTSPADGLAFAFTATGVVTIVLYAVTLGTALLRGGSPPQKKVLIQAGRQRTTDTAATSSR
jgi:hypothetical protein